MKNPLTAQVRSGKAGLVRPDRVNKLHLPSRANLKPEPVTIRKAKQADVPALVKMWKEFTREHDRILLSNTREFRSLRARKNNAVNVTESYFKKNIRSRNTIVYIAESGNVPAGYLRAVIRQNPPIFVVDKIGHIDALFVRKPYRGAGISSRFRDVAVDWFRQKGLTHMSLNVAPENTNARGIYRKWGFCIYQETMRAKL